MIFPKDHTKWENLINGMTEPFGWKLLNRDGIIFKREAASASRYFHLVTTVGEKLYICIYVDEEISYKDFIREIYNAVSTNKIAPPE